MISHLSDTGADNPGKNQYCSIVLVISLTIKRKGCMTGNSTPGQPAEYLVVYFQPLKTVLYDRIEKLHYSYSMDLVVRLCVYCLPDLYRGNWIYRLLQYIYIHTLSVVK